MYVVEIFNIRAGGTKVVRIMWPGEDVHWQHVRPHRLPQLIKEALPTTLLGES